MPIRLDRPLPKIPCDDENDMLAKLQGNILKGHGRKATALVLLAFDDTRQADARRFLAGLGRLLTSAHRQAGEAALFRSHGSDGASPVTPPFVSCLLSAAGYRALGLPVDHPDYAFRRGMKERGEFLQDEDPQNWERRYRDPVHALVLVGGTPTGDKAGECGQVEDVLAQLRAQCAAHSVRIAGVERGRAFENRDGHCIEHFGFVDGRSQPLFTEDDLERERAERGGTSRWDPAYPLNHVLVRDPGSDDANAFGSYFVYRKLEQNVRGFNRAIADLTARLNAPGAGEGPPVAASRVEAMIVGRSRDGTPLARHASASAETVNDFNYDDDLDGRQCPLHAHIRKANPRGSGALMGRETLNAERSHFFARRAIPYGSREFRDGGFVDEPGGGVGLLFMSCHADIRNQFEHVQRRWLNERDFPGFRTGTDPIVGAAGNGAQTHGAGCSRSGLQYSFEGFVSLRGGDYFFAPSIPFFQNLA